MSGLEILSLAIGAPAFATCLLKIGRSLQKTVKTIRNARPDLRALIDEIEMFAGIYHEFEEVCPLDADDDAAISSPARDVRKWTEGAISCFEELLERVKAIAPASRSSLLETWIAHLRWLTSGSNIKALRAHLSVARESINCLTNIRLIENLRELLHTLRSAVTQGERREIEQQLGGTIELATAKAEEKL